MKLNIVAHISMSSIKMTSLDHIYLCNSSSNMVSRRGKGSTFSNRKKKEE